MGAGNAPFGLSGTAHRCVAADNHSSSGPFFHQGVEAPPDFNLPES
jgi:hypothetical protein